MLAQNFKAAEMVYKAQLQAWRVVRLQPERTSDRSRGNLSTINCSYHVVKI